MKDRDGLIPSRVRSGAGRHGPCRLDPPMWASAGRRRSASTTDTGTLEGGFGPAQGRHRAGGVLLDGDNPSENAGGRGPRPRSPRWTRKTAAEDTPRSRRGVPSSVDIRDIRELERDGRLPRRDPRAAGHAGILSLGDRARKAPYPQAPPSDTEPTAHSRCSAPGRNARALAGKQGAAAREIWASVGVARRWRAGFSGMEKGRAARSNDPGAAEESLSSAGISPRGLAAILKPRRRGRTGRGGRPVRRSRRERGSAR